MIEEEIKRQMFDVHVVQETAKWQCSSKSRSRATAPSRMRPLSFVNSMC